MTNVIRMANPERADQAAKAFLAAVLQGGPVPVQEVYRLAAAAGITRSALRRAKQVLRVEMLKSGWARGGAWSWQLPPT